MMMIVFNGAGATETEERQKEGVLMSRVSYMLHAYVKRWLCKIGV